MPGTNKNRQNAHGEMKCVQRMKRIIADCEWFLYNINDKVDEYEVNVEAARGLHRLKTLRNRRRSIFICIKKQKQTNK